MSAASPVPMPPRRLLRHPLGLVALGLGSGLSPWAPGTAGSLVALLLWWPLSLALPALSLQVVAWLALLPLCVLGADWAATRMARKDPGCIVSDEWAGQWLALLVVPLDPWWWLAAFVLFRVFDIGKPWPMRALERLPGGVGIVADDVAAGVYAAAVLLVGRWWLSA